MEKKYIVTYEEENKFGRELKEERFADLVKMWALITALKTRLAVTGIWLETRQRIK